MPSKRPNYQKEYYERNVDHIRARKSAFEKANAAKRKDSNLRHRFGITLMQYNSMFAKQGGKCAICSKHQSELKIALSVDHNHATGQVRGLLCSNCNHMIGHAKENVQILQFGAKYLITHTK